MSWTAIVTALTQVLNTFKTAIISGIAYALGKRSGAKDEQNRQREEDLDAIARAERAGRSVEHLDDSVRDDPFNRDNA